MGKQSRVAQVRVHIFDDKRMKHSFNPGDEVPESLMKFCTNEAVFQSQSTARPAASGDMLPQEGPETPLEELDYKTLLGMAKDANIEFDGNPKKDDVIDALRALEMNSDSNVDEDEELV